MNQTIETSKAPAAIGPYSQAVRSDRLLFTSGQLPIDPQTGTMPQEPRLQARQSLANVRAILEQAGLTMADVTKATVFVTDLADFEAVNEEYAAAFEAPYPARSCVQVAALPKGAAVEVEVVAARPS